MIDEKIKNQMKTTISGMVGVNDGLTNSRIKKADYDKTLIGFVSAKIVPENPKDDNDYRWRIQTNGVAYDIAPKMSNITSVGQRVRLYIPKHSYKDKYAEVIENNDCTNIKITNDNITFRYNDGITESVSLKRDEQGKILSFTYYGKTITVERD